MDVQETVWDFFDEDGNFVKEAKETENERDNQKINCPKYFNVTSKLSAVNKTINNFETKLRYLRTTLLDGKKSSVDEFDRIKKELLEKFKERELLDFFTKSDFKNVHSWRANSNDWAGTLVITGTN